MRSDLNHRNHLRPDGDAARLKGKLVAHYHTNPVGATIQRIRVFGGSRVIPRRREDLGNPRNAHNHPAEWK
jgi:hypothetical protein